MFGHKDSTSSSRTSTLRASGARVGIQMRGDLLSLVRVRHESGQMPMIERLQHLDVELSRRADAIRRLAGIGVLRDAKVCVLLAPGEYDLYQVPAPNVPADEMRDAVRWQLRGTLPYSPEDATVDFVRVPPPAADANPSKPTLLVVAAPKATVEQTIAPFLAAGAELDSVDVPEFAQRNLAALVAANDGRGTLAWLSFDTDALLLTAQRQRDLSFARRIHLAGAGTTVGVETETTAAHLVERIVTQVQRSLDLFERQSGQPAVSQLIIGPHRHGAQIARQLADRVALATREFDPEQSLRWAADVPTSGGGWNECISALGAALRSEADATRQGAAPSGLAFVRGAMARWFRKAA